MAKANLGNEKKESQELQALQEQELSHLTKANQLSITMTYKIRNKRILAFNQCKLMICVSQPLKVKKALMF